MNNNNLRKKAQEFVTSHPSLIEMYVDKVGQLDLKKAIRSLSLLVLFAYVVNKCSDEFDVLRSVYRDIRDLREGGDL